MKYLPLVFRNLLRNRRRTLLTVLSIGVSIFIFAALISLPAVVDRILSDSASDVRVIVHNKAGFFYALPHAYESTIRAMPHVVAVSGYGVWTGTYRKASDQVAGAGIDPDAIREMWPDWKISQTEVDQLQRVRNGCIAAPAMMKRFGWKVGDTITLDGSPEKIEVKILGTMGGSSPMHALIMRRDFIDEASPVHGQVILYWVKADHSDSIPAIVNEIDSRFANSAFETKSESEITLGRNQLRTFRLLFDGVKILAFIVIVVIGMVAANTAAMAVRERRNEMAVMRSLGFTSRMIVAMVLSEGALIGCAGGVLGCALAYVALALVPYAGATLGPIVQVLRLLPIVAIESFLIAAAIGLLSALVPALSATRRDIASELRAL
ncbi:MAG: ABC transporter permease [Candidatus Binataceae bacterium]